MGSGMLRPHVEDDSGGKRVALVNLYVGVFVLEALVECFLVLGPELQSRLIGQAELFHSAKIMNILKRGLVLWDSCWRRRKGRSPQSAPRARWEPGARGATCFGMIGRRAAWGNAPATLLAGY